MKIRILLVASILVLSGCNQQAEPTNTDNGMIEAQGIERVLTASDVHITDNYQFAVSDTVIEGFDTYAGPVSISTDNKVDLMFYGSNQPIDENNLEQENLIAEVTTDGKSPATYEFSSEEQYQYYLINAPEECDIVVAVA